MPGISHAPEDIVFVGPQFLRQPIPDNAHIVWGNHYPRTFEPDDTRTPAERYAHNFEGLLRELVEATREADGPLEDWEMRNLKSDTDFWNRCVRATTVILGSNGYFPPVYEPPVADNVKLEPAADVIPHPRVGEIAAEYADTLQEVA